MGARCAARHQGQAACGRRCASLDPSPHTWLAAITRGCRHPRKRAPHRVLLRHAAAASPRALRDPLRRHWPVERSQDPDFSLDPFSRADPGLFCRAAKVPAPPLLAACALAAFAASSGTPSSTSSASPAHSRAADTSHGTPCTGFGFPSPALPSPQRPPPPRPPRNALTAPRSGATRRRHGPPVTPLAWIRSPAPSGSDFGRR